MDLVLATQSLASPGGSETYLATLARELDRLGHDITIVAPEPGPFSAALATEGFSIVADASSAPARCDAALVLDAPAALDARATWPAAVVVQCAMSEVYDVQMPPRVPGVVDAVVVLSERVAARVRATAGAPRCVRLRQPIDTRRFGAGPALPETPRRAVVLSNYADPERLAAVREAFAAAGVECIGVGARLDGREERPEEALRAADIVVAKGRAALEGMSCGRAVYLLDFAGRDGWVTAETYPAQEADAFAGQASALRLDPRAIAADVATYDPAMGDVNRDLVLAHHSARVHAREVVELLQELGATDRSPRADADLRELARVARAQWRIERESANLLVELQRREAVIRACDERALALERQLHDLRTAPRRRGLRVAASGLRAYDRMRGR